MVNIHCIGDGIFICCNFSAEFNSRLIQVLVHIQEPSYILKLTAAMDCFSFKRALINSITYLAYQLPLKPACHQKILFNSHGAYLHS